MLTNLSALSSLVLVLSLASPAGAQVREWTDRGFVNVGIGFQAGSSDFRESLTAQIYLETATYDATHAVDSGILFDLSGGVRVWRNLGVGFGFTRFADSTDVTVLGSVPHPLFFGRPRSTTSTATGLDRRESATHLNALWMLPVRDEVDVALVGGVSIFRVSQEVVTGANVSEGAFPFNSVAAVDHLVGKLDDTAVGLNIGADVTYLVRPQYGIGFFLRYAAATVDFPAGGNRAAVSSDVGGLQFGAGARLRF